MTPSSMKVRLVRCPRCRQVLAELPNISLYKCGGCGTILQAKQRKTEANNTVSSVTKIQRDSFPGEEEARSSDLDFPGPPLEESSPDKDDVGFQHEAVESSSEQSDYRSAYNGLCSSPEFNCDTEECSRRHDSQIYDNKLHDSDEDSTRGGNFSGEFPSSMEANERLKVLENIYLDSSTKVDQSDGEQSPKVWQGEERFKDEVRIFYGCGDQNSLLRRVDAEHREGIDDIYAHLEPDIVSENEATILNHDLTSPPEEEFSSDIDSRNVSDGLLSMPGGDYQYGDSTVGEFVIHDKVKWCSGIDSKRYVTELHDSDGESSTGGNLSGGIPSSSELVYQGIEELATEAKRAGRDEKMYSDQPTKRDQCKVVEVPDHVDKENGGPPVIAQHMEGICNYNVKLENNYVSPEEARSSYLSLGCQHKEKFLPDKDSIRYHDELVESSTELSKSRSISNGLLSLPEVRFIENKDTDESLNHDNSQDLKTSNSGLLDLGEDEKSFFDGPKKLGHFEGGESLRMFRKSDDSMHKVQNISECEAQENGLATVNTEDREGTNNHVHLEHYDVSKEVAGINKQGEGINYNHVHLESGDVSKEVARNHSHLENNDVSKEVARNHSHLENNDVSKEEAGSLNHDLSSPHKEALLLYKTNIRFQDEHMESRMEFSVVRSVSNDLSNSPQINCCQNEDPVIEESSNKDHDGHSLAPPDFKKHENGLHGLDDELSGVGNLSGEIRSSTELVYHEIEGLIPEIIEHTKSDNSMHKVQNISEHEAQENGLATVSIEDREGTNNHVHLEYYDVSKEVAGINKQAEGINYNHVHLESGGVSKEVARNHSHLENNDVSKEGAGSLNHDLCSPYKEELLLDKTNIRFQDEHVESRMEFSVVRSVSNDLSSSPQINCCQNEDPLMEESSNKDHDRNPLAPDFKKHENGVHGLDGELSGGGNLSGEIRSSTELVYHETEGLIPEVIKHTKEGNKSDLDQTTKVEQVQVENSLQVCPEGDNTLHVVHNFSGHEGTRRGLVGSSATETVSYEDGDASPRDDGFRGGATFNTADTNNPSVGDTVVASQVVSMGMPANLTSFDGKHVDRSPRKGSRNFGSVSSVELLGDSLFSETSPERRVKPQDIISPVTTRGYYAYDGSESSNDETDGQIPVYVPHSSRRKGKEVGYSSSTLKREGFAVKNMMSSESEMEYWAASPLSQHHAITGSHGNSDEFSETSGFILTSGNAIRLNGGGSSRLPLTSRNLHANQRLRGPSVRKNNLPPLHPGYHSPDKTSRSEPDKIAMLRTVCELKDQLNRIQFPKISRDGRFPSRITRETVSPSPLSYDHLIPGRERGVDLNHHGNYQWYDQEKGRVEQSNVSALALSGEAAYHRHQVNCSCLHCRSRDWHSSAPLLPHSLHYNDRSVAPISHNSHNVLSPLTSQNYSSYECLVPGHESMSDNLNHVNNENGRFYLRDRYHASKRHIRPLAGGSPFVTCYHCSETLQLPADFLVFRKRYHQLRCNACSKVLKFSLAGGKHIVPYLSRGPEINDSSDVTNERSLLVMPHSNFCQHGEPVSCSDDYGRSFCRSCSTEGEASVTVPSPGLVERKMYNRKISSVSSYEAMEDRKMKFIMKNSMEKAKNKNKKKISVETSKSFGTSSDQPNFVKPSSEIEELPPSPNSPLHRLMGYSSISQVLNKERT